MCGIIGYVGARSAGEIIYRGLENLEYRGYDSAGVALVGEQLAIHKRAGEVAELTVPEDETATCGIGHTRWSTHGPPTDINAHPHVDCAGEVAVVHNGIIENHEALRDILDGCEFVSETDTEVIPHLLEQEVHDGASLTDAVASVADAIEGSYAFAVVHAGENTIVATREQSPLVLGRGEDGMFLASDIPAFLEHTREVAYLEDGQVATITADDIRLGGNASSPTPTYETVEWDADSAEKGGYEHYMRKEIHEQPQALRQTLSERIDLNRGTVAVDLDFPTGYLDSVEEVQFVAAGTSYYASRYGARLLEELADVRTSVTIASEYEFGGGRDPWRTLTVAVTQSGETTDTLEAINSAGQAGARTLAVTNVIGSSVTRSVDDTLFIKAGPEIGVAASKTFSSQVTTLGLLAVAIAHERDTLPRSQIRRLLGDLNGLPGAIQQVLDEEDAVRAVASEYLDMDAFFFIGRELGYPVALEGALKLKEIAYVHAEGFAAGELKHGPLALVTGRTPVIALLTNGAQPAATTHNVAEAQTRGAPAIGIVAEGRDVEHLDVEFTVPSSGLFEPLVGNVYLQLLAYHIANQLGRPIDKPRNLAKSVTVR